MGRDNLTGEGDWPKIFSMASLGQELKRERELRGISLREIADSTRISLRFLEAIEEDELDRIPGTFFVRAILRSYARTIGLDEHQVLNKYQEMQAFAEQQQEMERPDRSPHRAGRRLHFRNWVRLAAAASAVIAVGLALFFVLFRRTEPERSALVETALPATQPVGLSESPPAPEPLNEKTEGLRLRFDFVEETWLHVYADGESVWDGTKNPGESIEVSADREIILTVGNAGGFSMTINGKESRPLGPRGAVRSNIRITPENQGDFLIPDRPNES